MSREREGGPGGGRTGAARRVCGTECGSTWRSGRSGRGASRLGLGAIGDGERTSILDTADVLFGACGALLSRYIRLSAVASSVS